MITIIIWIKNPDNPTWSKGDVIDILPSINGEYVNPGIEVIKNTNWRVIDIPDMNIEEAEQMIEPQMDLLKNTIIRRKMKLSDNFLNSHPRGKDRASDIRINIINGLSMKPEPEFPQEENVIVG